MKKKYFHYSLVFATTISIFFRANSVFASIPFYYEYKEAGDFVGKLCFIGDTGTGTDVPKKLADLMIEKKCKRIFIPGDVIYPSGIRSIYDERLEPKFYKPFEKILSDNNDMIIHLVMGNHDYRNNIKPWLTIAKEKSKIFFPNPYYAQVFGNKGQALCILALDTTPFDTFFYETEKVKQILWVKQLYRHWNDQKVCSMIITWAHHPHTSSGHHGSPNADMMDFLEKFALGVPDIFIAGHEHQLSDEGVVHGTRQLISGAGAKTREIEKNKTPPFALSKNGFVILDIKPQVSAIHYEFWALDGNSNLEMVWENTIKAKKI